MDFQIDYLLFLALTGRAPGDQGWWTFDATGIRSTLRDDGHNAHQAFQKHRLIEGAKLDFPALASELRRVEENLQERLTPDWFRAVVECTSLEDKEATISCARNAAHRIYDQALKTLAAARDDTSGPRNARIEAVEWAEQEANNMMLALEAVERVDEVLKSTLPNVGPGSGSSEGFSRMTPKESGKKGGQVSNASNNEVREKIVKAYKFGPIEAKNKAMVSLAREFNRAESSVRELLKGVEWVGQKGG